MKKRSSDVLLVALCLLAIVSSLLVMFIGNTHEEFEQNITVNQDGQTDSVVAIRNLTLNPNESKQYSVNLVCDLSGSYIVDIDFIEIDDGGMKQYVQTVVRRDGIIIFSGGLDELLNTDKILSFESVLNGRNPVVLTFEYIMPYEVGNDAQGTTSDFDVNIKITKE